MVNHRLCSQTPLRAAAAADTRTRGGQGAEQPTASSYFTPTDYLYYAYTLMSSEKLNGATMVYKIS